LEVWLHTQLTWVLDGDKFSVSRQSKFIPGGMVSHAHWIRGWVDLGASRDFLEERALLPLCGRQARIAGTCCIVLLLQEGTVFIEVYPISGSFCLG
jgi:hypothetical protein